MSILFKNIKELIQVREDGKRFLSGIEMKELPTIKNAYLIVEEGRILDYGSMENLPNSEYADVVDAKGKMILPCWCDSHTHIVYAGNREGEFVDRINGLTYQEIAEKGGGILNSAKNLQSASESTLVEESSKRLEEVIRQGTGAIEIKSGYGLTVESEMKILRVIRALKKEYPVKVKASFLGAHAFPEKYKDNKDGYIDLLINDLLPLIHDEQLAEYIDVFCEKGYFSVEDTERILVAGKDYGLIPKIHVNQFNSIGGVQIGVQHNALSVDHLEIMKEADLEALVGTQTMPVALPACSHFLSIAYTPARTMIDRGLPIALASDYNPGSSPTGNMNFIVAEACIKMKMTPEEAINAATLNGAYAMGVENELGSITKGKIANLIITKEINSYAFMPYEFASNHIDKVYINGKEFT